MNAIKKYKKIILAVLLICITLSCLTGCAKKFSITFDSDGGSEVEQIKVKKDEIPEKPANPTRENYVFDGWYNGTKLFNFNTNLTEDVTLKAKWLPEFEVTFDAGNETDPTIIKIAQGKPVTEIISPTKENNKFVCWCLDGTPYDFTSPITENITLTAQWKAYILATKIKAKEATIEIKKGQTATINIEFTPKETTEKGLTYQSNKTSVATVTPGGIITGVKSGTASILVTYSTDISTTITVNVTNPLTDLEIGTTQNLYIYTGDGHTGTVAFGVTEALPTDRDPYDIKWFASNSGSSGVVTIDPATGLVTAANYPSSLSASDVYAVAYNPKDNKEILKSETIRVFVEPKFALNSPSASYTASATESVSVSINSNCEVSDWGYTPTGGISVETGAKYIVFTIPANVTDTITVNATSRAGQTKSFTITGNAPPIVDPPVDPPVDSNTPE